MRRPIVSVYTQLKIQELIQDIKMMVDNSNNDDLLEGYAHHCLYEFSEVKCNHKYVQEALELEIGDFTAALIACDGDVMKIREWFMDAILGIEEEFDLNING